MKEYGLFPADAIHNYIPKSVEIRDSKIAGKGAFAKKNIKKGTRLGRYMGKGMDAEALDAKYGKNLANYCLAVVCSRPSWCGHKGKPHKSHKVCVDAFGEFGWASMINDGPHSNIPANVAFSLGGFVYALRDIGEGEEILVDYGPNFW